MTELQIATGRRTKADFAEHRTLDSKRMLIDTDGGVWICSRSPASHALKPADESELAALEAHFGDTWRSALAGMRALVA